MAEKDPHVIGARIARRRHELGLSQVELAAVLGVSSSTVANWERGASYPLKMWGKVEQALGINLVNVEPEEPEPPTAEEIDALREHMREVLGARSGVLEKTLDKVVSGEPPSGRGRGAARGRSSARRRAVPPS